MWPIKLRSRLHRFSKTEPPIDVSSARWRTLAADLNPAIDRSLETLVAELTDIAYPAARRLGIESNWLDLAIHIQDALLAVAAERRPDLNDSDCGFDSWLSH